METLAIVLIGFIMIATLISIAVDNFVEVIKPFKDLTRYKLIVALVFTTFGILAYNQGILEALGVPLAVSRSWFHWFDLIATTWALIKGAQVVHRISEAYSNAKTRKYLDKLKLEMVPLGAMEDEEV